MTIKTVVVGELETNCYIISDEQNCAIIDPGADAEKILKMIGDSSPFPKGQTHSTPRRDVGAVNVSVPIIILTHAHPDHLGAVGEVAGKLKCQIYMHSLDSEWLKHMFGSSFPGLHNAEDGEIIKIGSLKLKIIHTPGHTPGSICLYMEEEGIVFSGDTLFAEGVGRTDLPGGDESALRSSLKNILGLPGLVKVYPGHGPDTIIKKERDNWITGRLDD